MHARPLGQVLHQGRCIVGKTADKHLAALHSHQVDPRCFGQGFSNQCQRLHRLQLIARHFVQPDHAFSLNLQGFAHGLLGGSFGSQCRQGALGGQGTLAQLHRGGNSQRQQQQPRQAKQQQAQAAAMPNQALAHPVPHHGHANGLKRAIARS